MPLDTSHTPPPPKTRRATAVPRIGGGKRDKRTESVTGLMQVGAAICMMTGNYADAAAIGMHGENISREVVNLADTNEQIGKAVDYLTEVGPYAGLITATLPLVMQLLANHKRIPPTVQGVIPPDVLEARTKAEMQMRAALAMREAQQMRSEAQSMQDELARQNGTPV